MLEQVIEDLKLTDAKKVVLYPLMIVAGDHANNDMAGEEDDSWTTQLKKAGYEVEAVLKGLGEYEGIQKMYVEHIQAAIDGPSEEE
jgi:sirohydrochlorin cobaltochelatase